MVDGKWNNILQKVGYLVTWSIADAMFKIPLHYVCRNLWYPTSEKAGITVSTTGSTAHRYKNGWQRQA
ncbi:hypothetical protein O9929_15405 [Vibrio lentus]|nr:hypothetical protein [Vibrio lentus]